MLCPNQEKLMERFDFITSFYYREKWNNDIKQFDIKELLIETGAVISGSLIIRILDESIAIDDPYNTEYEYSDVDFFISNKNPALFSFLF
jgi:hypothetical protein